MTLTRSKASTPPAVRSSRRPSSRCDIQVAAGADSATPTSIAVLHTPAATSPYWWVSSSRTTVHVRDRQNESTKPAAIRCSSRRRVGLRGRPVVVVIDQPTKYVAGGGKPLKWDA